MFMNMNWITKLFSNSTNGSVKRTEEPTQPKPTKSPDFESMTKRQLEAYGRKHLGIELDRRRNKAKLIARLKFVMAESQ